MTMINEKSKYLSLFLASYLLACAHDQDQVGHLKSDPIAETEQRSLNAQIENETTPTLPEDPMWRHRITNSAKRLNVTNIEQFENGVFGHYRNSRIFFTTTHQIPNDEKLYWVMVKVLSEKYSCFMINRRKSGDLYRFYCKDQRSVVMRIGQVNQTLYFYGRTYDRFGNLILLKGGKPKP